MLAVADQMQYKTVKNHFVGTVMRICDVAASCHSTMFSNLQIGQLPEVVCLGFVDSEDFYGSVRSSPFQYQHFDVQQIGVEVDGQSYPTKPYVAKFDRGMSLEGYDGLLNTLGRKCNPYEESASSERNMLTDTLCLDLT